MSGSRKTILPRVPPMSMPKTIPAGKMLAASACGVREERREKRDERPEKR